MGKVRSKLIVDDMGRIKRSGSIPLDPGPVPMGRGAPAMNPGRDRILHNDLHN